MAKKLRPGSIPSGSGKGKFPITDQKSVHKAKDVRKQRVIAHVRAEAKKRGLKLTPAFKPKTDKVHAVDSRADIELGSYGSKWRHGWIPLNTTATALKLKQLKAGGGHSERRAGHHIVVAPNHRGAFGALVTKDEKSHYSEHPSKGHALRSARAHAYKQQSTEKLQTAAQERTRRISNANVAREESKVPEGYKTRTPRNSFTTHVHTKDNEYVGSVEKRAEGHYVAHHESTSGGNAKETSYKFHGQAVNGLVNQHRANKEAKPLSASTRRLQERAQDRSRQIQNALVTRDEAEVRAAKVTKVNEIKTSDPVLARLAGSKANYDAQAEARSTARERAAFGLAGDAREVAKAQHVLRQSEINSENPPSAKERDEARATLRKLGATRRTNPLSVPKKTSERVPEGFTDTASNGKQYDHNAITGLVHRRDGAQVGTMHQNADGSWKIEGVGGNLPSHTVKTRSQAINGLALAHDMYLKDSAAKKAKVEADKASAKNAMDASAARSRELETAALRVLATRTSGYPKDRYTASRNIISGASGSTHEERLASIKAQVQKYKPADLQRETLFQLPVKAPSKPRSVTKDTDRMQRARAELERRTGTVTPLDSTPDEATLASISEGMPVTHGGRAGHVIARYGQTFDTYHPPIAGGATEVQHQGHRPAGQGFYMRHHIVTRRGKKSLNSTFAGWSAAKAG